MSGREYCSRKKKFVRLLKLVLHHTAVPSSETCMLSDVVQSRHDTEKNMSFKENYAGGLNVRDSRGEEGVPGSVVR